MIYLLQYSADLTMKLGELTGTFTNIDLVNLPAEKLATLIIADRLVSAGPYIIVSPAG
jgi:hypothetical protein